MGVIPALIDKNAPEMRIYFGTDARIFSIFLGMALGLWRTNGSKRKSFNFMRMRFVSEAIFAVELAALVALFFLIDHSFITDIGNNKYRYQPRRQSIPHIITAGDQPHRFNKL